MSLRARSLWVLALWVAAAGCRRAEVLTADLPAGIDRVAVLELDPSGVLSSATGLMHWSTGQALPIAASARGARVVVGWSSSSLAGVPSDAAATAEPLAAAIGCAPRLPRAAWAATWQAGALVPREASSLPALGASWLDAGCPDLSGQRLLVDLPCSGDACPAAIPSGACAFDVDLTACGGGRVTARVDRSGRACVEPEDPAIVCTSKPNAPDGATAFRCGEPWSCELDAYLAPAAPAPPFELARATLFPGAPAFLPDNTRLHARLSPRDLTVGYLFDLAVLDDRAVVAGAETPAPAMSCELDPGRPRVFRFVDLDTLAEVSTATAPTCADRLLTDPAGGGFLATYLDDTPGRWRLGRFDRAGRLTASAPSFEHGLGPPHAYLANEIVVLADPPRVAILYGEHDSSTGDPPVVVIHDAETLEVSATLPLTKLGRTYAMDVWDPQTLAIVSDDSHIVVWLDLASGHSVSPFDRALSLLSTDSFLGAVVDAQSARVLVPSDGAVHLLVTDLQGAIDRRAPIGLDMSLASAVPWPGAPPLVLFGGLYARSPGDWDAIVTLFDAESLHFRPGSYPIGVGLPSRLRADRTGRIFALLPWAGEVVRLTPRAE